MIKEMWYKNIQWNISHKNNLVICDNMEGSRGYYSKLNSPSEKSKYWMISLAYENKEK